MIRGGSISSVGGAVGAGHWRCSGTAGIGSGFELVAQALSPKASVSKALLIITGNPFCEGGLLGLDAALVLSVGAAGSVGGLSVVALGAGVGELFLGKLDADVGQGGAGVRVAQGLQTQQGRQRDRGEPQPGEEGADEINPHGRTP